MLDIWIYNQTVFLMLAVQSTPNFTTPLHIINTLSKDYITGLRKHDVGDTNNARNRLQ